MATSLVHLYCLLALLYSASATEMCRVAGVRCVDSCVGVASGNYHSCTRCSMYVTCVGNTIYRDRPCPVNQVWDSTLERCDFVSATCKPCSGPSQTPTKDSACTQIGGACVDICLEHSACQKGVLYAGLCSGSVTRRCCIPKEGITSDPTIPATTSTAKPVVVGTDEAAGLEDSCVSCIAKASGGVKRIGKCGSVCGPFALTWAYWADCGKPETYRSCTTQMECSSRCVRAYLGKYSKGVSHNCEYYARVHRGGPYGWKRGTNAFWRKVNRCCRRRGGC